MAEEGDKKAAKMLKMIEEPTKFISTIQIGITLAGFLGSAFAADNFAKLLTEALVNAFNVDGKYVNTINNVSVVIITLILSYFTLVLGELVPKRIAMKYKEKLANAVCGVISFLSKVLKPIIWFLTVSTNGVLRLFGINPHEKDDAVSEEDIVIMLDAGADEGTLNKDDIKYIKNVFKLDYLTAADIMTPRSSMVAVPADISEKELLEIIEKEGYSRIPVYEENIDDIIGILYVKDYLLKHGEENFSIKDVLLPPEFVPETVHLDSLFKDMQDNHMHMAIVVNEYGLALGVVTMEDIIEELVGEIWDEQDEAVESIVKTGDNTYRVLSSVSIDEFFDFFELPKDESIESTTVNGWLTERFDGIPEVGQSFDYENLSIAVTVADEQMSHEVQVTVLAPEEQDTEEEKAEEKEKEKA